MYDKTYEVRLQEWRDFRAAVELAEEPLQLVIDKYTQAPLVTFQTDPWDRSIWPSPWELILENQYCEFCKLLGICYTLQLTDRFSSSHFEIHISADRENSKSYYLLFVDDYVIGYEPFTYTRRTNLPSSVKSQTVYAMGKLH